MNEAHERDAERVHAAQDDVDLEDGMVAVCCYANGSLVLLLAVGSFGTRNDGRAGK